MSKTDPSETDLELFRRVENEPLGTFKKYVADQVGTEENIAQHLENIDELSERIKISMKSSCFIEVISIRLQIIDFWLRVYFSNVQNEGQNRQREFGRLIRQVFNLGLPKELYDRLSNFNMQRIDAIHGYVVGTTNYDTISNTAVESDSLLRDTVEFVVRNVGEPVTHRNQLAANPGAMVLHVEGFCNEIKNGIRY